MYKLKIAICFLILHGFSLNALDQTPRQELEATSSYRLLNGLTFIGTMVFLTYTTYDYFTNEENDTIDLSFPQIACSMVISACSAKVCAMLPPLSSFIFGKKKEKEKSTWKHECEGFLLWVQDAGTRVATNSIITCMANGIPSFQGAMAHDLNMQEWCQHNYNGTAINMNDNVLLAEPSSELSLNLIFVSPSNRTLEPWKFLSKTSNPKIVEEKIIKPLTDWTKNCPSCNVILWLDHRMESESSITNTMQLMCKKFHEQNLDMSNLQVSDLRQLPLVKKHPDIFSNKVSIYPRVDIFRILVTMFTAKPAAMYVDLDILAFELDLKDIFNRLEKEPFLFVSGKDVEEPFENSLFFFSDKAQKVVEKYLINLSVKMINNHIKKGGVLDYSIIYSIQRLACLCWKMDNNDAVLIPTSRLRLAEKEFTSFVGQPMTYLPIANVLENAGKPKKIDIKKLFNCANVKKFSVDQINMITLFFDLFEQSATEQTSFCPTINLPVSIDADRGAF